MKHNLRMAFLSLLLVLTLGVMPVFAESADHAMDWTHGIDSRYRTDVTARCRLKTNSSSSAAVSCCASMTPNMSRKSSAIWKTSSGRKR